MFSLYFTFISLEASDQLLVQLQLFPTQSTAVLVPDAVAQGSPLFFMPPNSDTPVRIFCFLFILESM